MALKRIFLGWDGALTDKVRDFVLPEKITGPVSLAQDLIVVPTKQAGRRLREVLAVRCAEKDSVLLDAQIVPPTYFFLSGSGPVPEAEPAVVKVLWAGILEQAETKKLKALFPAEIPEKSYAWALSMGETIQALRNTLAEGGFLINDVVRAHGDLLVEKDRWGDLARLESFYLGKMKEQNLEDPCERKLRIAGKPELPEGVRRVVIAGVPDPTLLAIRALEEISKHIEVVVLVHAPDSLEDLFDKWGRPIPGKWRTELIDIPAQEENIRLAEGPASQSRMVIEQVSGQKSLHYGVADLAIGVPDHAVVPFLTADLGEHSIAAFDPGGKPVAWHPLYQLVKAVRDLLVERSYSSLSAFLRHGDVLACMTGSALKLPVSNVLAELDNFQNECLPIELNDIWTLLDSKNTSVRNDYPNLGNACRFIRQQLEVFEEKAVPEVLRLLLQVVYRDKKVSPINPVDEEFIACADKVDSVLHELESAGFVKGGDAPDRVLDVLLRRLDEEIYELKKPHGAIDLEGWIELPWNDAPCMIITGMNEGFVPDSQLADVFLPDSLRSQLNLRDDAHRFGRDVYLLKAMIESRKGGKGNICLIAGRTGMAGDPLKPSRLLFRCSDKELIRRAERLFGETGEKRPNAPLKISLRLDPSPPQSVAKKDLTPADMPVTAFRDYLACPFRFYLGRILGMQPLDDQKNAMDAMDFGEMVHHALRKMSEDRSLSCSTDHKKIRDMLWSAADHWVFGRYGMNPPLMVRVQLDAAKVRLSAAAEVQAGLAEDGWETVECEKKHELNIEGMPVRGKIDRVDRNSKTGMVRILDYKTSDNPDKAETAHLVRLRDNAEDYAAVPDGIGGSRGPKQWKDLQLPLYRIMYAEANGGLDLPCEVGYFNLPKAVADTEVCLWEGYDRELSLSALSCAKGVILDIKRHKFWPPSEMIANDGFESLFPLSADDCFDVSKFFGKIAK